MDVRLFYAAVAGLGLLIGYCTSFRLAFLVLLFLISLMNVFKAPTSAAWMLSIYGSERSIIFIPVTIVAILIGMHTGFYSTFGTVVGLIAVVLFISPIVRAYFIAQQLPANLNKAFASYNKSASSSRHNPTLAPFSFRKLIEKLPKASFKRLTYATHDDKVLTLDFYAAHATGKRPCVVAIHGGSWARGNSRALPELNSHLAKAGYHVAAINYRLVPQWQFPAPIEDTVAALQYLRENAEEMQIDADKFVLLGRSAGGQIALLTAYTHQDLGIKGVVNFYGPADMVWGYKVPTNPWVLKSCATLEDYIGGTYKDVPDKYRASSPFEFVTKNSVPTLTFHGVPDALVFVEHARRLAAKLTENNVPHFNLELPWATHGFDYHLNGPGGQLSTYTVDYFLRVVTE